MEDDGFSFDAFLSYAWEDGVKERVQQVKEQLEKLHGLAVWHDSEGMALGVGTVDAMAQGINDSRVFVCFVTARYRDKVNSKTQNNCQIEFRFAHKSGTKRIIPVAFDAEMQNPSSWTGALGAYTEDKIFLPMPPSQSPKEAEASINRLAESIRIAAQNAGPPGAFRSFMVGFDPIAAPSWTVRDFVPGTRAWLFDAINSWATSTTGSRVMVLIGGAGTGKSVVCSELCRRAGLLGVASENTTQSGCSSSPRRSLPRAARKSISLAKNVLRGMGVVGCRKSQPLDCVNAIALHFFKFDDQDLNDLKTCILSLANQLAVAIPSFGKNLVESCGQDLSSKNARTLFRALILEPALRVPPPGKPVVVVLDAVDECTEKDRVYLVKIIADDWRQLPSWFKLLASARPEAELERKVQPSKQIRLLPEEVRNEEDMRTIIKAKVSGILASRDVEVAVSELLRRSQGLPLFARFVDLAIQNAKDVVQSQRELRFADIEVYLPLGGIDAVYEGYFRRLLEGTLKGDISKYRAVLEPLVVARAPLPTTVFTSLAGLSEREMRKVRKALDGLVVESDGVLRFAHKSMADWLSSAENSYDDLAIDPVSAHATMGAWCTTAHSQFAYQHAVYHLALGGRERDAADLFLDFKWLVGVLNCQAKLAVVLVDCQRLLSPSAKAKDFMRDFDTQRGVCLALEKSLQVLVTSPDELASQLVGRLGGLRVSREHPLVASAEAFLRDTQAEWLRPLNSSLEGSSSPMRKVLRGHSAAVYGVYSAGHLVVTASADGSICVWDIDTCEVVHELRTPGKRVEFWAAVLDDQLLAAASDDGTLWVWVDLDGAPQALNGHSGSCSAVGLGEDFIVSGSYDNTLRIWSRQHFECTAVLTGHEDQVSCVATSDKLIASGSFDATARIWSLDGSCISVLHGHVDAVNAVKFVAQERFVTGSEDKTVRLWSLDSLECIHVLSGHTESVTSLALSPDGSAVYVGSQDSNISVWSLENASQTGTLDGRGQSVWALACHGDLLVSGCFDGTIRLWLPETTASGSGARLSQTRHSTEVSCAAMSDEKVFTGDFDGNVLSWSRSTGEPCGSFRQADGAAAVTSLTASKDLLFVGRSSGAVEAWSTTTDKIVWEKRCRGYVTQVSTVDGVVCAKATGQGHVSWTAAGVEARVPVAFTRTDFGVDANAATFDGFQAQVALGSKRVLSFSCEAKVTTAFCDGRTLVVGDASGVVHLMQVALGGEAR